MSLLLGEIMPRGLREPSRKNQESVEASIIFGLASRVKLLVLGPELSTPQTYNWNLQNVNRILAAL
jgi:hypothetical protein